MSFGSSRSTRFVRKKTKQPVSPSKPRDRPYSPDETKKALDKKKRTKALGLNYLRSTNRQAKQSLPKGSSARSVMESIKKFAQKSGAGMNLKQIFKRLDLDGNGVNDIAVGAPGDDDGGNNNNGTIHKNKNNTHNNTNVNCF